ncbi:hypothetical protein ANO14919_124770 [Xylariales sp. No.14919]|nr:hypothetical protein ANO14919_124770 [Xylariales sp. No.14919]
MVGFVERFRKPKLPVALGLPQRDGVVHQQTNPRPRNITPPVLRNFSYPTNITIINQPPFAFTAWGEPPSIWDQLGEICNFSPNVTPRLRQDGIAGLEDPFFYTTDRTSYKQLVDPDEKPNRNCEAKQSTDSAHPTQHATVGKCQRRSTSLVLPSSQARSTSHL